MLIRRKANAVIGGENVIVSSSVGSKKPAEVEPSPLGAVVVPKESVTMAVPNDGVDVTPFTRRGFGTPNGSESKF